MSDAKWFTGARKFPQLIGRTPDGGKLWGGPYTITQVVVAAIGALVLWNTSWLWMRFSLMGNLLAGPGVLVGIVWAVGKLPFGMRNPLIVGSGWLSAVERLASDPSPTRLRRPHLARADVLMIAETEPVPAASVGVGTELPARAEPEASHALVAGDSPLTGVQQLLLTARK